MNKFLKKFLYFLILPLVLIIFADYYLANKNSLYKEKFNGAFKNAENIEILILGNSHAHYGVDPNVFDYQAYNLANVNQSLYFDKRITLKLLPELKNLKYVLISADYHSLAFASQGIRDVWSFYGNGIKYENKNYFFEQLSPSLFGYPPKVILSYLKRDFINMAYYKGKGVNFPVQKGVNILDSVQNGFIGYQGRDKSEFEIREIKDRAASFNKMVSSSKVDNFVSEDLDVFLAILKSNDIVPILFTPPTYIEYNKQLDPILVEQVKKRFKKKSKKYGVPYWDYMNLKSMDIENFYDMDHLNKIGAKKFGKILNDSIKKYKMD